MAATEDRTTQYVTPIYADRDNNKYGLGSGVWSGTAELKRSWRVDKRFQPKMRPDVREAHLARWRRAVERA